MTTIEPSKRALAEQAIGQTAIELSHRLERGEVTPREMILACRRIIDLWVRSGGVSYDDEVLGVLGIESQCDHVMLPEGAPKQKFPAYDDEEDEIASLGSFFRESFTREMRALAERFPAA